MKARIVAEFAFLTALINEKTEYCAFFNFSGHVDWIDVKIRKSKEEYNVDVATCRIRLDEDLKRIVSAKKVLTDILDKGEIDYDLCEVEEVIEVHHQYSF